MVALTEQELSTQVKDHLLWDDRVRLCDLDVTVDGNTAILSGTVPNRRAKIAAEEDAKVVAGVHRVDNRLKVQYLGAVVIPPDAEIAESVKKILTWDTDIDETKIEVSVVEGIVTLRGTVDAYWKRFRAEEDANWGMGVVDVINEVMIVPTHQVTDEDIAMRLEAALERDVNVEVEDVSVTVEDGVVTLTGIVPTWSAWQATSRNTTYTPGVRDVIDQLAVRS
jgi:osmotically-inducible protein OsmY